MASAGGGDTDHAQPSDESSPERERAAVKRHLAPGETKGAHAQCHKCHKGGKACHCVIYIILISDKVTHSRDPAFVCPLLIIHITENFVTIKSRVLWPGAPGLARAKQRRSRVPGAPGGDCCGAAGASRASGERGPADREWSGD